MVCVNTVLAIAIDRANVPSRRAFVVAALGLPAVSIVVYFLPVRSTPTKITVGQPGVDLAFGDPEVAEYEMGKSVDAIESHARSVDAQLVVLPEGLAHIGNRFPPNLPFHLAPDMPTIFGGQRGDEPAYQTAFGYDGRWVWADKTRLVIFGEFVPGRSWLPFLSAFRLPTGDLTAGDQVRSLRVGGLAVGPVICFEGLFPDIAYRQSLNGVRLLAVMSMDDWFMGTTAPDQLRAASVWRAIETGLPLVRSASTGYSLAVDGKGDLLAAAPIKRPFALDVELPLPDAPLTPYWLPAFPIVSLASCLALPFWAKRRANTPK